MKPFWPRFFSYVQSAEFYRELHQRAVRLLPAGDGRSWFDVGTGPGLVARLAGDHGYRVTGFDLDPQMIEAARVNARQAATPPRFETLGMDALAAGARRADVVSAASLLAVVPDKEDALRRLMSCVKEGGALLVIETTSRMQPAAAWAWLRRHGMRGGNWILLLWARARVRQVPVDPGVLAREGYRVEHTDLFAGMVSAWVIRREARDPAGRSFRQDA